MALGMTNAEMAQLAIQGVGGLASGMAASKSGKLSKEQQAAQMRMQALQNLQQMEGDLQNRRTSNAAAFADRSPLGAEQAYAQRQKVLQSILPQMANFRAAGPTSSRISSTFTPTMNPLSGLRGANVSAFSDDATARALTDRRTALAGIDPTATEHYRPLSDYGLDKEGVFNQETQFRTGQRGAENAASEQAIRQAAMQQYNLSEEQAQEIEKKQGGGFWKTLAKVGLIAGGAIATAMTAGAASPLLGIAIGAGTGAASGALDGGGKGAILGGLMGGVGGAFGGAAAKGAAAARAAGVSTGDIVRQSILNPRTLAQMTGAGIGGDTGAAIHGAANFLPGAQFKMPHQMNNQMGSVAGSGGIPSQQGPGLELQSSMNPPFAPYPQGMPPQRPQRPPPMGGSQRAPMFSGVANAIAHPQAQGSPNPPQSLFQMNKANMPFRPQDFQHMQNYGQAAGPGMQAVVSAAPAAMLGQMGRGMMGGKMPAPSPQMIGPVKPFMRPPMPMSGAGNMANQQSVQQVLDVISKAGLPPQEAAKLLANPQFQQMLRALPMAGR